MYVLGDKSAAAAARVHMHVGVCKMTSSGAVILHKFLFLMIVPLGAISMCKCKS